jgi:Ca2+-binding RTX toxin-like protein
VVPTRDVFTMTSATLLNGFTKGPGTVLPPEFVNQKVGAVQLKTVNGVKSLVFTQNDYFDFLTTGESIKFKVKYTMNDGHAGGDSQSIITFTLKGGPTAIFAGNGAANNMLGENDKDTMDGKGGNDTIFGRGGNDLLIGGAGNDKVTGGLGADQYFTGSGKDIVFINSKTESGPTAALRDKFMDFVRGQDKINLAKIDSVAGGSDQAFEFIGMAAFGQNPGDNRGQLRYGLESGKMVVYGDISHNGTTDFSFQVNATPFADFFVL